MWALVFCLPWVYEIARLESVPGKLLLAGSSERLVIPLVQAERQLVQVRALVILTCGDWSIAESVGRQTGKYYDYMRSIGKMVVLFLFTVVDRHR